MSDILDDFGGGEEKITSFGFLYFAYAIAVLGVRGCYRMLIYGDLVTTNVFENMFVGPSIATIIFRIILKYKFEENQEALSNIGYLFYYKWGIAAIIYVYLVSSSQLDTISIGWLWELIAIIMDNFMLYWFYIKFIEKEDKPSMK